MNEDDPLYIWRLASKLSVEDVAILIAGGDPSVVDGKNVKIRDTDWANDEIVPTCSIPDVCIDERRLPLFIARATLGELIAGLEARATGGAAP
jgi:hypothetical protein